MISLTVGDFLSIELTPPNHYEADPTRCPYAWVARHLVVRDASGGEIRIILYSGETTLEALRDLALTTAPPTSTPQETTSKGESA